MMKAPRLMFHLVCVLLAGETWNSAYGISEADWISRYENLFVESARADSILSRIIELKENPPHKTNDSITVSPKIVERQERINELLSISLTSAENCKQNYFAFLELDIISEMNQRHFGIVRFYEHYFNVQFKFCESLISEAVLEMDHEQRASLAILTDNIIKSSSFDSGDFRSLLLPHLPMKYLIDGILITMKDRAGSLTKFKLMKDFRERFDQMFLDICETAEREIDPKMKVFRHIIDGSSHVTTLTDSTIKWHITLSACEEIIYNTDELVDQAHENMIVQHI